MMGRRGERWSLFYQFRLDERVPKDNLLRRIDGFVTTGLADIHERLSESRSFPGPIADIRSTGGSRPFGSPKQGLTPRPQLENGPAAAPCDRSRGWRMVSSILPPMRPFSCSMTASRRAVHVAASQMTFAVRQQTHPAGKRDEAAG
jgi:hypothetical protein